MDWESLYCPNRHGWYDGRPFFQGQLVRMAVVTDRNKRMRGLRNACVNQIWTPPLDCTQTQRFLRRRCGHERKAMRSERRHASSKSTKRRVCMAGSSGLNTGRGDALPLARPSCHRMPADELWSFVLPKQHHVPCARSLMRPMAMQGLGRLCTGVAARACLRDW